jgi:site-specific recombinase XerC
MKQAWTVDATRILTRSEVRTVLDDLARKGRRSVNQRQNRAIFRLSTCCGLRASEIAGLRLQDVVVNVLRPYLRVRATFAKGGKARRVALWWDGGTLADLSTWRAERTSQGAGPKDFLVCTQATGRAGRQLDRRSVRTRFRQACKVLGPDRLAYLTVHHGRHSFVSHALNGGRSLAEVRDAAGHSNVATTSIYTHIATEDDGTIGDLFKFDRPTVAKNGETREAATPENTVETGVSVP